jgi:hypothetical protein
MKTTFRLEKSRKSTAHISIFDVLDSADSICGRITVDSKDAPELLSHWCEAPRNVVAATAATAKKRVIDALMEAKRGTPVAAAPARSKDENPMIAAMLRVAPKNRLSQQAILRG